MNTWRCRGLIARALAVGALLGPGCAGEPAAPGQEATPHAVQVSIAPGTESVRFGTSLQLGAAATDSLGTVLHGVAVFWTSSDTTVLAVRSASQATVGAMTSYAVVRGFGLGSAVLRAVAEGHSDSVTITVLPITFTSISAGGHSFRGFTCALATLGDAFCWGNDYYGELGDSARSPTLFTPSAPRPTAAVGQHTYVSLSSGAQHVCALTPDGLAYCWGLGLWGQTGRKFAGIDPFALPVSGGMQFTSVRSGYQHTCGTTSDGSAYCWGWNEYVQLGSVISEFCAPTPCSTAPLLVPGGHTFVTLAAGSAHTCGITSDGAAYCWGDNYWGALGNGTSQGGGPTLVSGGLSFSAITAGDSYTCGVTASGAAYCWGLNNGGQLGTGSFDASSVPVRVRGGLAFRSISAPPTGHHTCGVTTDDRAYCWGDNVCGQLGVPEYTGQCPAEAASSGGGGYTLPVPVSGGLHFATVSTAFEHSCGLTTDGLAYCWGRGNHGELGDGLLSNSPTPVLVAGQR